MAAAVHDGTPKEFQNYHLGLNPFDNTVTVATTQINEIGDDVLLFGPFPSGSYFITDTLIVTASDIDSGGTPAVVLDFGVSDSDGVIDTVLIDDTSIGQTGGSDATDEAVKHVAGLLDVGGKYITCTVVTAPATAAAGTIRAKGLWVASVAAVSTTAVS